MSANDFAAAAFGPPAKFEVDGATFELRPATAAEWVTAMYSDHYPVTVAPGMLQDPAEEVISDRLMSRRGADGKWIARVARRALQHAGGRAWWETQRLVGALSAPRILGALMLRGVDPHRMNLPQLTAAVYALLSENRDEKGMFMLDAQLVAPPVDADLDDLQDEDDFAAIARQLQGMPGVSIG